MFCGAARRALAHQGLVHGLEEPADAVAGQEAVERVLVAVGIDALLARGLGAVFVVRLGEAGVEMVVVEAIPAPALIGDLVGQRDVAAGGTGPAAVRGRFMWRL